MRLKATILVLVLLTVGTIVATNKLPAHTTVQASHIQPAKVKPNPPTRLQLLTLVNDERAKHGVAPLIEDTRLDISAQRKADDEVKYDYFGHVSPHDGLHGYIYINDVGIYCSDDGENLTENVNVNDAKTAVDAWISSPPHHKAMINPLYTLTGFGISGNQLVEHFCQQ